MKPKEWAKERALYKVRTFLDRAALAIGVTSILVCVAQLIGLELSGVPIIGRVSFGWLHVPVVLALLSFLFSTKHFFSYFIDDVECDGRSLFLSMLVFLFHFGTFVIAASFLDYWLFSVSATIGIILIKNYDLRRALKKLPGHPVTEHGRDWLRRAWHHFNSSIVVALAIYCTTQNLYLVQVVQPELVVPGTVARFYRDIFFLAAAIELIRSTIRRSDRVALFTYEKMGQYQGEVKRYWEDRPEPGEKKVQSNS